MIRYISVPLKNICDTHRFDIHPFLNDAPYNKKLMDSIKLSDILHPPTILQIPDGNYDVLCGRQRLKFCQSVLQKTECLCRILPQECSIEDLLVILLEDQFSNDDLTIIEQSHFVNLCSRIIQAKTTFQSFLRTIPPGRITRGLNFLLPLVDLDYSLQKKIHFSVVTEKILGELQKYSSQDQVILANLIEKLQLGVNNQKKLLLYISEILQRNTLTLSSLLASNSIDEVLNHSEMNTPQKTTQLFSILYKMYFPLLSSAEEIFKKEVDGLKLPNHCHLKPTKAFESDEVTLSIRFKNMASLKETWSTIRKDLT